MAFDIAYKKSVQKDLAGIGKAEARRILDKIEKDLATRADACPVLKGQFSGLRKPGTLERRETRGVVQP